MAKSLSFLSGLIAILLLQSIATAQPIILQNNEVTVVYDPSLENAVEEIIHIYPILRQELEDIFGWSLYVRPRVVLVKNSQTFQKITNNKFIVAFAVPEKNLIVIDYSKTNIRPFSLSITLKHELCHLLLHSQIRSDNFAKWLDEGICQWVSDGIGEIFLEKGRSGLDAAILAGTDLSLSRLTKHFPRDKASLILAYEQSKSVVAYIYRQYGENAILTLLDQLKNGETLEAAGTKSLGISIDQLEEEWLEHLERTPRWLVFLANNVYGILFFLAALLTVFGFIRRLMRKRAWERDQEED